MLAENARRAPLRRNVTTDEVGNAAAFLGSDMSSGITGEIMYVDAGFNITGMGELEDAEI
ncbi:MAG: SDR family oxidoreductase [Marinobacter sp.]|nr:SDR family oxidoreductase [Marinobacter sp.]